MGFLVKYQNAKGLVLFSGKTKRIEVWYFPPLFDIVAHKHPKEDIEVLLLFFGFCKFYRIRDPKYNPHKVERFKARFPFRGWFKKLSVPAGALHWFHVGEYLPLIAVNIATFKNGETPVSAAEDFVIQT